VSAVTAGLDVVLDKLRKCSDAILRHDPSEAAFQLQELRAVCEVLIDSPEFRAALANQPLAQSDPEALCRLVSALAEMKLGRLSDNGATPYSIPAD
jgi:hypothetical protein